MIRGKRLALISLLIAFIVAALGVCPVAAAPAGPRLRIEPPSLEVNPGEDFSLQVMIEDVENLGGFQVEIAYDPSVMEVEEVVVGDFLTSTGRSKIPVGPKVNNEEGVVVLGAATFGDSAGPNGSGVLASINCTARGDGSSALRLRDVQVLDTAAGVMSVETEDGQLVVGEGGAEPTEGETPTAAPPSTASPVPTTSPSDAPDAPTRPVRWVWIGGAALLAALGAAALIYGLRNRGLEE